MSQTYLITGTSRGIGLELCRQVLGAGHQVLALARKPDASEGLKELAKVHGAALKIFAVDVTSDSQVEGLLRDLSRDQAIDVLINNAGVYGEDASFEKLSLETVEETFATNALAPMRVTRALLPWLRKSRRPKVVHITSRMGSIQDNGGGGHYGYRMSKAALNMFHKSFSVDFPDVISVVVHPGWVQTDMGGTGAPVKPADSAKGILQICDKIDAKAAGKFFDFKGEILPW